MPGSAKDISPAATPRLLAALAVTIAAGLLSRLYSIGWFLYDHSLGDVLYAVALYLLLALLCRRRAALVAPLALGTCWAIEAFQATGIPARCAHLAVVRWLLGTTFSWHDMICYAAGIAGIAALDHVWLRRQNRQKRVPVAFGEAVLVGWADAGGPPRPARHPNPRGRVGWYRRAGR